MLNLYAVQTAVVFLTRPLILSGVISSDVIPSLQIKLENALLSRDGIPQILSLASSCLPAIPLQLACVAFGIKWADWIKALSGGSAFDLVIDPTCVFVVKKCDKRIGIVWVSMDSDADVLAVLASIYSMAAADELARGNTTTTVSDAEFDPHISRPSSRSSNVSDSAVSFSSQSSISSASSLFSEKYPPNSSVSKKPVHAATDVLANKNQPTKYIYSGGISTVLSGGVMLANKPKPVAPMVPPALIGDDFHASLGLYGIDGSRISPNTVTI